MALSVVSSNSRTALAVTGIGLCMGSTYNQTASAQWSKYGSPYGSYGGYSKPYKQYPYKQYDPYDDDDKPRPSEDRGDMVPFKRSGGPAAGGGRARCAARHGLRHQRPNDSAVSDFDGYHWL